MTILTRFPLRVFNLIDKIYRMLRGYQLDCEKRMVPIGGSNRELRERQGDGLVMTTDIKRQKGLAEVRRDARLGSL